MFHFNGKIRIFHPNIIKISYVIFQNSLKVRIRIIHFKENTAFI